MILTDKQIEMARQVVDNLSSRTPMTEEQKGLYADLAGCKPITMPWSTYIETVIKYKRTDVGVLERDQSKLETVRYCRQAIRDIMTKNPSENIYGLMLKCYAHPICRDYYGQYPWMLKRQISMEIENYISHNEQEVVNFLAGSVAQQPGLDF
jgi:hypothetical protein